MRRAVVGVVVAGLIGGLAACGTGGDPAGAPSLTPEQLATKNSCEAIGSVYTKNLGPFAEALSKMTASGDAAAARKNAQAKLSAFGAELQATTDGSQDAQMRADGRQAADQLRKTSADDAFFKKIKTTQDVSDVVGPMMKQWLAPVTHHCS
jgi:hypothetical protein